MVTLPNRRARDDWGDFSVYIWEYGLGINTYLSM